MSIPLHPATVHFPIALLSISYALDALLPFHAYIPSTLTSYLPAVPELSRISYYALTLGLLSALPAVSSGIAQAIQAVTKQGLYDSNNQLKPKMKTLIAHAVANDAIIAASAFGWWYRSVDDKVVQGDVVRPAAAVALGLALVWSGHLGAHLTYENGMGMAMGKKGKSA